jgi:hypothetical protein
VNPGPLVHLRQGLAYLAHWSVEGELPTQRLLNKSVKIGTATVYVTRGKTMNLGSLGLTLPVVALPPSSDDATPAGPEA